MTALNFKQEFSKSIKCGQKRQTIRRFRKDGRRICEVGGKLQLYTGMQTKKCELVADAICTGIDVILINRHVIYIDDYSLNYLEMVKLAKADGFKTLSAMLEYFEYVYSDSWDPAVRPSFPFQGYFIKWELA